MLTLCIDTSYKYLSCALIKDKQIIAEYNQECFKRQSEEVFIAIDSLFKKANIDQQDIDSIALSIGPGSYTGVRIGLTIAKVISTLKNIDLYTISTLKLYANNKENTMVLLNARSNRAYVGVYNKGETILNDQIIEVDKIDCKNYDMVGDASLINKEDKMYKISECFLNNFDYLEKVSDKHHLVPVYLKESEAYLK